MTRVARKLLSDITRPLARLAAWKPTTDPTEDYAAGTSGTEVTIASTPGPDDTVASATRTEATAATIPGPVPLASTCEVKVTTTPTSGPNPPTASDPNSEAIDASPSGKGLMNYTGSIRQCFVRPPCGVHILTVCEKYKSDPEPTSRILQISEVTFYQEKDTVRDVFLLAKVVMNFGGSFEYGDFGYMIVEHCSVDLRPPFWMRWKYKPDALLKLQGHWCWFSTSDKILLALRPRRARMSETYILSAVRRADSFLHLMTAFSVANEALLDNCSIPVTSFLFAGVLFGLMNDTTTALEHARMRQEAFLTRTAQAWRIPASTVACIMDTIGGVRAMFEDHRYKNVTTKERHLKVSEATDDETHYKKRQMLLLKMRELRQLAIRQVDLEEGRKRLHRLDVHSAMTQNERDRETSVLEEQEHQLLLDRKLLFKELANLDTQADTRLLNPSGSTDSPAND